MSCQRLQEGEWVACRRQTVQSGTATAPSPSLFQSRLLALAADAFFHFTGANGQEKEWTFVGTITTIFPLSSLMHCTLGVGGGTSDKAIGQVLACLSLSAHPMRNCNGWRTDKKGNSSSTTVACNTLSTQSKHRQDSSLSMTMSLLHGQAMSFELIHANQYRILMNLFQALLNSVSVQSSYTYQKG